MNHLAIIYALCLVLIDMLFVELKVCKKRKKTVLLYLKIGVKFVYNLSFSNFTCEITLSILLSSFIFPFFFRLI